MDAQTAHFILNSIATVAAVVWLAGLLFLFASARQTSVGDQSDADEAAQGLPIHGMVEVDGEPEDLALRAAAILAKGIATPTGPMRIVSRTADAVVFEDDRAGTVFGQFVVRRGAIHFARMNQGRTRVEYALDVPRRKAFLYLAAVFQMLGLLTLACGYWLLKAYVVDAANLGVRAQVVQMAQVCHFLWPPFLLGVLFRRQQKNLRNKFDTLICNLPFYQP